MAILAAVQQGVIFPELLLKKFRCPRRQHKKKPQFECCGLE